MYLNEYLIDLDNGITTHVFADHSMDAQWCNKSILSIEENIFLFSTVLLDVHVHVVHIRFAVDLSSIISKWVCPVIDVSVTLLVANRLQRTATWYSWYVCLNSLCTHEKVLF